MIGKKIKIVRVKENKCKGKRRYDWCSSKEKNINAAWRVATFGQRASHDPNSSRRHAPPSRDG